MWTKACSIDVDCVSQVCILNYKKSGEFFWNHFYLAPMFDDSGVVEYYIGNARKKEFWPPDSRIYPVSVIQTLLHSTCLKFCGKECGVVQCWNCMLLAGIQVDVTEEVEAARLSQVHISGNLFISLFCAFAVLQTKWGMVTCIMSATLFVIACNLPTASWVALHMLQGLSRMQWYVTLPCRGWTPGTNRRPHLSRSGENGSTCSRTPEVSLGAVAHV